VCIGIIGLLFSDQIIGLFRDDPEVIRIGALALRFRMAIVTMAAVNMFFNMFLQTCGYSWRATFLSLCRQGLTFIPLVLILPRAFGLIGLQLCQPIGDVMCFTLSLIIGMPIIRKVNELAKEQERQAETSASPAQ